MVVEHFGTVIARPVIPVCPNPSYATEWLGIDVTADPAPLLGLSPEELARAFSRPETPAVPHPHERDAARRFAGPARSQALSRSKYCGRCPRADAALAHRYRLFRALEPRGKVANDGRSPRPLKREPSRFDRNRRLNKDYENLADILATFGPLAACVAVTSAMGHGR